MRTVDPIVQDVRIAASMEIQDIDPNGGNISFNNTSTIYFSDGLKTQWADLSAQLKSEFTWKWFRVIGAQETLIGNSADLDPQDAHAHLCSGIFFVRIECKHTPTKGRWTNPEPYPAKIIYNDSTVACPVLMAPNPLFSQPKHHQYSQAALSTTAFHVPNAHRVWGADLNRDKAVNVGDYLIFASEFGNTYP